MYVDNVNYQEGVGISSNNISGISAAVTAAASADVTVLVMGIDQSQESEGRDRSNIALPGQQNNLIAQVAAAAKGCVILVVFSGGCVDISKWRDSDDIAAIIWAGYSECMVVKSYCLIVISLVYYFKYRKRVSKLDVLKPYFLSLT
eukprot:TRINITY_DN2369_c0_g1_i1.p1 TRINITY_DN2369_c0_g1~~TRINITY_DN2369_c0_g1_i1.p1  ORF type:complete len:161 (+),score=34.08 TRINITY_DN2369_c0_g1_i1:46-483(+)